MFRRIAVIAVTLSAVAGPALAQILPPTDGIVKLAAGFEPDPHIVDVLAGGTADAAGRFGGGCAGRVSEAPNLGLAYAAGDASLTIRAFAETDITLVVRDPNGRVFCDDDSGESLNPLLTLTP